MTLEFLSDERLSELLTIALRVAARRGGHFDRFDCWHGPRCPTAVWLLVDEYKRRLEIAAQPKRQRA